ncbi:MAG: arsenate reductase (glutaredoxin) [Betaproteobacteria bacterium]|nr:arsenate reductase (glutaredoxin) [Betaproteobacteria bacterium]
MSETVSIFHNPRCSKSRGALALLEAQGVHARVVEYLKTPPSREELRELLRKLGARPEDIVRKGEELYKTRFKDRALGDEEWLDVLAANPILIERPIVVVGERAVVGRPPERVLELL